MLRTGPLAVEDRLHVCITYNAHIHVHTYIGGGGGGGGGDYLKRLECYRQWLKQTTLEQDEDGTGIRLVLSNDIPAAGVGTWVYGCQVVAPCHIGYHRRSPAAIHTELLVAFWRRCLVWRVHKIQR